LLITGRDAFITSSATVNQLNPTMVQGFIQPISATTDIFKDDIFKGKVLFCTGGGSGICKQMTESIVSFSRNDLSATCELTVWHLDETRR